jgi:hypothetical protein
MVTLSHRVTDPEASIKDDCEHHGRQVRKLRDKIADRGRVIQANQTLARLQAMFAWAVAENRVAAFPAASPCVAAVIDSRPHIFAPIADRLSAFADEDSKPRLHSCGGR